MNDRLTVGSLFSGIGGIDLGLERAGMVTRWFCEIDPHCRNVLARHWPGLPIYGDITTVDWSGVEPVDVLAGGFPCQPVSVAGHTMAQADERWLWPEFARAIRALRPHYVLVENVANLLAVNNGSAFAEVLGDLAESGYDAEWDGIPAAAVGALHQRDRIWTVAYAASGDGARGELHAGDELPALVRGPASPPLPSDPRSADVADTTGVRSGALWPAGAGPWRADRAFRSGPTLPHADRLNGEGLQSQRHDPTDGREPVERPPGLFGGAGPSGEWTPEPDVGRVAHGVPHRVDRLRALGNAVVPQVVEWIGARIVAFDEGRVVA